MYFFPGMDPYIEASGLWEDFHHHFIDQIAMSLAGHVPERYLVRSGIRSYMMFVDTALAEAPGASQPVTMRARIEEEHREAFIDIFDTDPPRSSSSSAGRDGKKKERRLVTSIEVLSPANKQPKTRGWKAYQRKRCACLLGEVNLVEIDLVRSGQRMPMTDPWPDSVYTLLVARGRESPLCKVWPVNLQEPVPLLPVPLATPDPDVELNLQPLIEDIYERFRYEQSIDYAVPLTPPLESADTAWVTQKLRKRPGRAKSAN